MLGVSVSVGFQIKIKGSIKSYSFRLKFRIKTIVRFRLRIILWFTLRLGLQLVLG